MPLELIARHSSKERETDSSRRSRPIQFRLRRKKISSKYANCLQASTHGRDIRQLLLLASRLPQQNSMTHRCCWLSANIASSVLVRTARLLEMLNSTGSLVAGSGCVRRVSLRCPLLNEASLVTMMFTPRLLHHTMGNQS